MRRCANAKAGQRRDNQPAHLAIDQILMAAHWLVSHFRADELAVNDDRRALTLERKASVPRAGVAKDVSTPQP